MSFERLITSVGRPWGLDQHRTRVLDYLEHVLYGSGQPLCPFVPMVHRQDGYRLRLYGGDPVQLDFDRVVQDLVSGFWTTSPSPTHDGQELDPTTMIAAFTDARAVNEAFGERLEQARNALRQGVLEQGLMLAHMSPIHPDPKGGDRYVSAIPMFMVRRMHRPDHVFMKKEEERAAYRRFFSSSHP